jgi:hypothetical protein
MVRTNSSVMAVVSIDAPASLSAAFQPLFQAVLDHESRALKENAAPERISAIDEHPDLEFGSTPQERIASARAQAAARKWRGPSQECGPVLAIDPSLSVDRPPYDGSTVAFCANRYSVSVSRASVNADAQHRGQSSKGVTPARPLPRSATVHSAAWRGGSRWAS